MYVKILKNLEICVFFYGFLICDIYIAKEVYFILRNLIIS